MNQSMTNMSSIEKANSIKQNIDTDLSRYIRLGWFILMGGFGTFLIWASIAPLDKGVPLQGTVTVASNQKAIQHETGGTVEAILVKEGAAVKAGQVLVRMNSIHAASEADATRVKYITARTMQARLIAERDNTKIAFNHTFGNLNQNPQVLESMALQKQIYHARRSAINSELSAIGKNISGYQSQIAGLESSISSKQLQQASIKQQLDNTRDLAKEGYIPSNRVLELDQTLASLESQIASEQGNIGRTKREVERLRLQRQQRKQEYQKEVNSELADVQQQANTLESQLKNLDRNVQNIEIKAPVDGTIVGLTVFTQGAVVQPGFTLMSIVPKDDRLVVEGQLPVHLIDKVYAELTVDLLFTAFNQNETPTIPGIVKQVSADRFTDEETGISYYKVVSQVAPEGQELLHDLKIRPGMPVQMFIKTGERTMMNYLLKPIADHLKLSLSEE